MTQRAVPYISTGKVLIGCAYQPRPPRMDRDAQRIQAALLDQRTARPLPPVLAALGALWRLA